MDGFVCRACNTRFDNTDQGTPDLRLRNPREYPFSFTLGKELPTNSGLRFQSLEFHPSPAVDFSGVAVPHNMPPELLSHFPRASSSGEIALDLGCGDSIHREVCERAGYEYLGVDHFNPHAGVMGDAHSLPLENDSVSLIVSMAVLEHIRYPFVMMREAHRVLKPGGVFIGSAAYLEPFHSDSFYHHTHLGTLNSLTEGGFRVSHIAPYHHWTGLRAQSRMGLFPHMPVALANLIILPIQVLHRAWWKMGDLLGKSPGEEIRLQKTTGAFLFIATKKN